MQPPRGRVATVRQSRGYTASPAVRVFRLAGVLVDAVSVVTAARQRRREAAYRLAADALQRLLALPCRDHDPRDVSDLLALADEVG